MFEDTIAAIATPPGEGGIGVVRLSGPEAFSVVSAVFRCRPPLTDMPSHTVHHGLIVEGNAPVDEALATVFHAPRSYTGENVVEISCHGGTFLLKRVLTLCLNAGARLAEPGEFTRRAFLNGKMDLAQAEAVADLISAQSESFRRIALDQLQGRLSGCLRGLRSELLDLLARLEANLDFAEDEIPAMSSQNLRRRLDELLREVKDLLRTAPQGRLLREGLRAVLVGKPNVGKSSLFNALLRSDRAIVTEIPGTTRDTLEERLLVEDVPVILTDTAGLRRETGRVESEGMRRARRALEGSDVVLFVVDVSSPPSSEDRDVAVLLRNRKTILVLNKCDLSENRNHAEELVRLCPSSDATSSPPGVRTSARSGEGLNELRRRLLRHAGGGNGRTKETPPGPTLINVRHENLLKEALNDLRSARTAVDAGAGEECVAVDLKRALDHVNQITGEGVQDEILHAIFSRFCIGK